MPTTWTPLVLDSFIFDEAQLETPEAFSDLGGTQSVETHKYPGGTITQKSYGYFPAEQKWRGKFFGPEASDRKEAIKRILYTGNEVQLSYGSNAWLGRVTKFMATVRHNWLFEYELDFEPRLDISSGAPSPPTTGNLGTVLALHILALQSLITYGLDPAFVGEAVSIAIGGPIGLLIFATQAAIAGSGGSISGVSGGDQQSIFDAGQTALQACAPYQSSPNPVVSSPASDAAARVQSIQNIFGGAASAPITVIQTINPNLITLAAQYYGDGSQWRTIATPNGLSDPQPIGSYTLTIPAAPS